MKVKLFSHNGEAKADFSLPREFSEPASESLLKQAVRIFEDRTHFGLSKVKTRSEVNRTKKKLYKQKGTGGARHGAKSAPIFVGGGKAHGPKGVKTKLTLPLKMRKKALLLALSKKFEAGSAVMVDGLKKAKKTKDAYKVLKALKIEGKILIVLSKANKYYKNIKNVKTLVFKDLSAFEVMKNKNILFDIEIITKNEN